MSSEYPSNIASAYERLVGEGKIKGKLPAHDLPISIRVYLNNGENPNRVSNTLVFEEIAITAAFVSGVGTDSIQVQMYPRCIVDLAQKAEVKLVDLE